MDAWSVSKHHFPEEGSEADKLAFFVRYAILAPSFMNTQPWVFEIKQNVLHLYVDRCAGLPVSDPDDRGSVIACAAALFNLKHAARGYGYQIETEIMPDPDNEDLLATVRLGAQDTTVEEQDQNLLKSMTGFEFDHSAYLDKPLSEDDLDALRTAASAEGAWLYVAGDNEKRNILRMTVEADQMQAMNKHFRREFALWTDKRRTHTGDGLPEYAQSFSTVMNTFTPHVLRRFKNASGAAVTDAELMESVPCLAILGSMSGSAEERLQTGQGLMRLCLTAASRGLSVSPLNQVCEVPEMRLRLHDEISQQGRAHVVLRIGYGGKPALHARKPLESVLFINGQSYAPQIHKANGKGQQKTGFLGRFGKVFLANK